MLKPLTSGQTHELMVSSSLILLFCTMIKTVFARKSGTDLTFEETYQVQSVSAKTRLECIIPIQLEGDPLMLLGTPRNTSNLIVSTICVFVYMQKSQALIQSLLSAK